MSIDQLRARILDRKDEVARLELQLQEAIDDARPPLPKGWKWNRSGGMSAAAGAVNGRSTHVWVEDGELCAYSYDLHMQHKEDALELPLAVVQALITVSEMEETP